MKYNIFGYLIGEGFRNIFKNKKSTFACLGIMCATMLIFGIFFLIGENVDHMMKEVQSSQGMEAFIKEEIVDETQIEAIGARIKAIEGVNNIEYVSKDDALNKMKERFKDKQYLLEGYDIFPASYIVKLSDLSLSSQVEEEILRIDGIKKITIRNDTINTLITIGKWVRIITIAILIALVLISIFIITNTIKLTVHARRKEISIMKYVGATNGFIRWPFIVEGIIIGIIAAAISILIIGLGYNGIADKMQGSPVIQNINIALLGFKDMINQIVIVYFVLGIGVGIIGSSISMRKYLDV